MSLSPFVPTPKFEDYRERFKDHFKLQRRADGVLLAQAHTLGRSSQLSVENHRALGQLFKTVGADPENELLILTGSGEHFMATLDPDGFALERQWVDASGDRRAPPWPRASLPRRSGRRSAR